MSASTCIICKNNFETKTNKLFCSRGCKESNRRKPWLKHRKTNCDKCGFIPKHMCQLDVDHIDGNKENNNISNLQTLCANCHRLKSIENKDNINLRFRCAS